jgi:hypothetical protein
MEITATYAMQIEVHLQKWQAEIKQLQPQQEKPEVQARIEHYEDLIEFYHHILVSLKAEFLSNMTAKQNMLINKPGLPALTN